MLSYAMPSLHELLSALTASLQALYTTALVMLFCAAAYAVVGMELFKVPGGSHLALARLTYIAEIRSP